MVTEGQVSAREERGVSQGEAGPKKTRHYLERVKRCRSSHAKVASTAVGSQM
jgi:hypothetical protein